MIAIRLGLVQSLGSLQRTMDPLPDTYVLGKYLKQISSETSGASIDAGKLLAQNEPFYFKRNIKNIVHIAKANGIEVIIATMAYLPHAEDNPSLGSREYLTGFEEMNSVLSAVANETGAHLFDFANAFPKDPKYFSDGVHMTAEGVRLKSSMFAEYILENSLLPQ